MVAGQEREDAVEARDLVEDKSESDKFSCCPQRYQVEECLLGGVSAWLCLKSRDYRSRTLGRGMRKMAGRPMSVDVYSSRAAVEKAYGMSRL